MTAADLPAINASLNATAGALLILGMIFIKADRKQAHGYTMGAAFVVSSIFLVFYLLHKYLVAQEHAADPTRALHTPFGGEGIWRTVYYVMLISHIILAICVPPLAIITMRHALAGRYEKHRALSKITLPIWLYVSVTGVLVYFFLYRWFPAAAVSVP
jgi:putative membrane protein